MALILQKRIACVVFLVHGKLNSKYNCWRIVPAQKKELLSWLLKNCVSYWWRVVPAIAEKPCHWLLKTLPSDYWAIVPVAVKQSCQYLLNNRANNCWTVLLVTAEQFCYWLLNKLTSDGWTINVYGKLTLAGLPRSIQLFQKAISEKDVKYQRIKNQFLRSSKYNLFLRPKNWIYSSVFYLLDHFHGL